MNDYQHFMVYTLYDSGEKDQIDITKNEFLKNDGKSVLFSDQVVLIVDEELRRIYIWKGVQSSVRKKFIASRVASELQNELIKIANFHRCKVVSVDQGDEPQEFLENYGFSSMEVEELSEKSQLTIESNNEKRPSIQKTPQKPAQRVKQPYKIKKLDKLRLLSQNQKDLLNTILNSETPLGFERQHVILGDNVLYGIIKRKTEIFGKILNEESWNPVEGLNEEMVEFNDYKTRVYLNKETGIIKAVEFLKSITPTKSKTQDVSGENYSQWTVKQLKTFCSNNNIKVLSSYRKADLVKLVEDFNNKKSS